MAMVASANLHQRRRVAIVLAALLAMLLLVVCEAAFGDNYRYARTRPDDSVAASIALRASDVPATWQLHGGRTGHHTAAEPTRSIPALEEVVSGEIAKVELLGPDAVTSSCHHDISCLPEVKDYPNEPFTGKKARWHTAA